MVKVRRLTVRVSLLVGVEGLGTEMELDLDWESDFSGVAGA